MAFGRMSTRQPAEAPISAINVTPLVDVMLVLVVIFILTAPLLASSIRLDLPRSQAAQAGAAARSISLVLDGAGQAYLDDKPLPMPELQARLAQIAAEQPDTEIQLRADSALPYGRVVEVMDAAQLAGLRRIGFVTQPRKTGDQPR